MEKSPRQLSDDELIARLKDESTRARPANPLERNAPVDLVDEGLELDQDGVRE